MFKKEIEKILNEALSIMKTWNKELYDETLQDPKEIARLIKRQKEYDDFVHELAKNELFVLQMNSIIKDTNLEWYIRQIAAHVALATMDVGKLDLTNNDIHGPISDNLSFFSKEELTYWVPKLIETAKQHHIHIIDSYADYIGKNCLSEYVDLFIENDKLISNCSEVYRMLAMTQHPKAKVILKNILTYTRKTKPKGLYDIEYAATCLMLLGDEYGMQYFRERLSGGDPSYEDMGREVALWGNRADIELLLNFFKQHPVATDVLARTYMHGDKRLIHTYMSIMKSDMEEEAKEIAHDSIVKLFISKEEQEEYYEILEEDVWEDIIPMWEGWIEENYENLPDIRYYEAKNPWHIKNTLHEVKRSFNNPVAVARWQNVIIYTGHIMPFDPMAYYEKQLAQNKVMEEWIDAQGEGRFKEGRWYRFGKDVTDEPIPPIVKQTFLEEALKAKKAKTHARLSGKYQAHLPEGHKDKEKLKANPFAYSTYQKGDVFTYEGLEDFDVSLIEWRVKEE